MNINKKIIEKCNINDAVYCINNVLLSDCDNIEINFEKDVYDIHSMYAYQEFCYISNNDFGVKNLIFPIIGKKNITINGNSSRLNGIGGILPFYIKNSENIIIKNFTIDYARPFFSQGEVMESAENYVVINMDKNLYPYEIVNGLVHFIGEEYESYFVHGLLEYEREERRPIPTSVDNFLKTSMKAEETQEGYLKLFFKWVLQPTVGNIITIKHEKRFYPAIAIDKSENIKLENITIHHAGTMGVVAQFSKNIYIDKMDISPEKSTERLMSINADATHFVNCTGEIIIENSKFESMLDDIINVHGNYFKVSKVIDNTHIIVEIPHFQQVGAYGIHDGAKLLICNKETMLGVGYSYLKNTKVINNKFFELELTQEFNFDENIEYCIDDTDTYPEVIFRNNICGKNRARGLLLTGKNPILIENNIIDTEGSAIKVNGDMHNWYESTNITSIIIRGNKIRRRNKGNWGIALIDIDPVMRTQVNGEFFHGDMLIENNEIILDGTDLFYGYSFNSLTVKNNKIISLDKPINSDKDLTIKASNCGKVCVENNIY
ncbi:MAG: hypothetical protein R3Y35_03745 [Clostridia bacterium]